MPERELFKRNLIFVYFLLRFVVWFSLNYSRFNSSNGLNSLNDIHCLLCRQYLCSIHSIIFSTISAFFSVVCVVLCCVVCVCLCLMCRDKPKLIVAAGREIVPAQINCAPRYLNYDIIKLNAICCFCSVYVPFKGDVAIMCWPNAFLYLYLSFFLALSERSISMVLQHPRHLPSELLIS